MVNKMEKCLHPMLAKRDQNWFRSRIQAEMKKQGLGYLILQTPYNVFYATGYTPLVGNWAAVVPAEEASFWAVGGWQLPISSPGAAGV